MTIACGRRAVTFTSGMGQLFFKKPFQEAIRAGRKSTTIRRWDKPALKAGERAFSPGLGWLTIEAVDRVELERLSKTDAAADGFGTAKEMRKLLMSLYPSHKTDGKRWFRVRFALQEPVTKPPAQEKPRLFHQ